jgi:hypothetical protein
MCVGENTTSFIGFVRSGSRVKKLKFDRETGLKAQFVDLGDYKYIWPEMAGITHEIESLRTF